MGRVRDTTETSSMRNLKFQIETNCWVFRLSPAILTEESGRDSDTGSDACLSGCRCLDGYEQDFRGDAEACVECANLRHHVLWYRGQMLFPHEMNLTGSIQVMIGVLFIL